MIKPEDLRVDVYRNGTDNPAVRLTHMPTGTVVTCNQHHTQLRNKAEALRQLRLRLGEAEPVDIMRLPIENHDMTIGEYLATLAIGLVRDEVTAKHGFTGESDWRHDLYDALADGGALERNRDGHVSTRKADDLLEAALTHLVQRDHP